MDALVSDLFVPDRREALCHDVADLVPIMQHNATALDHDAAYPAADIDALVLHGCLLAPFPVAAGGLGLGTEPEGAEALSLVLRLLGRGNMAVGRLFEAHVNAVRLIATLGSTTLLARARGDAEAGHMFGLWVTDGPDGGIALASDQTISGSKAVCSGAGALARAVIDVDIGAEASRLAYVSTQGATVRGATAERHTGGLQGMRAAVTGRVTFPAMPVGADDWIGAAGAYLAEPDFSAGAWRTSAVTCGGLQSLVECAVRQLAGRGRAGDPHQLARIGRTLIAQDTALMWLAAAAAAAEGPDVRRGAAERVSTVGLARLAIEQACLDAMQLVARSIGLGAFATANPIERIGRDLATYLRQPASDEVLTEAAAHRMQSMLRPQ